MFRFQVKIFSGRGYLLRKAAKHLLPRLSACSALAYGYSHPRGWILCCSSHSDPWGNDSRKWGREEEKAYFSGATPIFWGPPPPLLHSTLSYFFACTSAKEKKKSFFCSMQLQYGMSTVCIRTENDKKYCRTVMCIYLRFRFVYRV